MEHAEKPHQEVTAQVAAVPTGASAGSSVEQDASERGRPSRGKTVAEGNEPREASSNSAKKGSNRVRKARIDQMMSKAELARRANLSVLTIDRVEKGFGCRMDTRRKILEALGLSLADRVRVFGEEE